MAEKDRVRWPKEYEEMLRSLKDLDIFKTYKDALIFAAVLGHKNSRRLPFKETAEQIRLSIFGEVGMSIMDCIVLCETRDAQYMSDEKRAEKFQIFEEYAHGGLEIIKDQIYNVGTSRDDFEQSFANLILDEDEESLLNATIQDIRHLG